MDLSNNVIFFTGAGISVESGVPTFNEQPGLRDKLTREFADENPKEYMGTILRMARCAHDAKPNAAHEAIREAGFNVITMNVDGLHGDADNVLELHGRLPERDDYNPEDPDDMEEFFAKDNITLYGDAAPMYNRAEKMIYDMDYGHGIFVVVGTSFYTGISNYLVELAKFRRADVYVINDNASVEVPKMCKRLLERE